MIKLKHILKEWAEQDPGPKRWFKPYGDKYTEYEKATNHGNKEYKTKPLKEDKSVDDTFMMDVALGGKVSQDEFFSFLDDIRHPDNSPAWTAYTLGWMNKRLGQANADLIATGAKIDPDGNIKWSVERG